MFISSSQLWDKIHEKLECGINKKNRKIINIKLDCGEIKVGYYNTGFGIEHVLFHGNFYEDVQLEGNHFKNHNFLCFNTGNNAYFKEPKNSEWFEWAHALSLNGEQRIGHISNSLCKKNKPMTLHCLTLDPNLFQDLTKNNIQIQSAHPFYQSDYINININSYMNLHQSNLLNEIEKTSILHGDKLQDLYLESKILDLVHTSLSSTENPNDIALSTREIEYLHKAKAILLANLQNPPSIKELAHKSTINEFALKKGFKQLFGTTVYGMLHEHRLQSAKQLLEANDLNVQEAALMVGYKSMGHFSKIFKDRFGFLPIELRKRRTIYT